MALLVHAMILIVTSVGGVIAASLRLGRRAVDRASSGPNARTVETAWRQAPGGSLPDGSR